MDEKLNKALKALSGQRDPYAIWFTRLEGVKVQRIAAHLLNYVDDGKTLAYIKLPNDEVVLAQKEQIEPRVRYYP